MEHLEVLIAFCSVILLASLIVTVITQIIIGASNLRGRNLCWGLKLLLNQVEPGYKEEIDQITEKILKFPLISKSTKRFASVIRIEELSDLLKKFSSNPQEFKVPPEITENLFRKKREIEDWFDNMTDRLSERFTLGSRFVSFGAAIIVAVMLQLDSIYLIQKVYSDETLRNHLIESSELYLKSGEEIFSESQIYNHALDSLTIKFKNVPKFPNRVSAEEWLANNVTDTSKIDSLIIRYDEILTPMLKEQLGWNVRQLNLLNDQVKQLGSKVLSAEYTWNLENWDITKYFGILISITLLSLGAPFWFNMLKNLVNLRSQLMKNEESERTERKKKKIEAGKP